MIFTNYAEISDGVVVQYPVNPRVVNAETGDYNVPLDWRGGELDGKTYVLCHNKEPSLNYDEKPVEIDPYFDEEVGVWYRGYRVEKLSDNEMAAKKAEWLEAAENTIAANLSEYSEARADELQLSDEQKIAWAGYRAALEALRNDPNYPLVFNWPSRPDAPENRMSIQVERI